MRTCFIAVAKREEGDYLQAKCTVIYVHVVNDLCQDPCYSARGRSTCSNGVTFSRCSYAVWNVTFSGTSVQCPPYLSFFILKTLTVAPITYSRLWEWVQNHCNHFMDYPLFNLQNLNCNPSSHWEFIRVFWLTLVRESYSISFTNRSSFQTMEWNSSNSTSCCSRILWDRFDSWRY
jgi:hypothetical protein